MTLGMFLPFGCKDKPSVKDEPPIKDNYGDRIVQTLDATAGIAKKENFDMVRNAILTYYTANGRYPSSLEDIQDTLVGGIDANDYDYDPETGDLQLR